MIRITSDELRELVECKKELDRIKNGIKECKIIIIDGNDMADW